MSVKYKLQYFSPATHLWCETANTNDTFDTKEAAEARGRKYTRQSLMHLEYRAVPVHTVKKEFIVLIQSLEDLPGYDGFKITTNKQDITVGIDNGQSCCESWGYFWSNDVPKEFIGAELLGISIVDTALDAKKFDKETAGGISEGDVMFVNFETSRGVLQFTAYNEHNGYYGHDAFVKSTQLNHEECL